MNKSALEDNLVKKANISLVYILSGVISLFMTVVSGLGLLFPDVFYPDPKLLTQYLANDPVNILVGLPLFLFSLIQLRKEKLIDG